MMIYHVVRRPFWHMSRTLPRFLGTTLLLGAAAWALALSLEGHRSGNLRLLMGVVLPGIAALRIAGDALILIHLRDRERSPLRHSAVLMTGSLARGTLLRFLCVLLGGIALPLLLAWSIPAGHVLLWGASMLIFLVLLVGELAERYLYFAAVAKPKMPGGLSA